MATQAAVKERKGDGSGYEVSRFNAMKHGVLSRCTVLSWENQEEYEALHASLVEEHNPAGRTEEHLVEELAGVIWRKRRLRLAEAATFRLGLKDAIDAGSIDDSNPSVAAALACVGQSIRPGNTFLTEAIHATPQQTARWVSEAHATLERVEKVLTILRDGQDKAYERSLKVLDPYIREMWDKSLEKWHGFSDRDHTAMADSLTQWIEEDLQPYFQKHLALLNNRDAIREQAIGEALEPWRLQNLARYETHLDRKLERTLGMLLKLQQLRREREKDG